MIVAPRTTRQSERGIRPTSYRLPDDTRLGRVRLQVADLDRSILFYEKVLGLRVMTRSGDVAVLGPHDDEHAIVELKRYPAARSVPRGGLLGLYHFAILLPDRRALGSFLAHLAGIGAHVGTADHAVSEAVYLSDPDGLGIEVYADRARETWRYDGPQVFMTTKSLDVNDLVAAARGTKWTGMPKGTVLGHVHLYVDDIAKASAFYHEALGFDKVVWSYPGALFLSAGGYHHHLGTNIWARGAPLATDEDARLLEWEVVVPSADDAERAAGSLKAAGYQAVSEGNTWRTADPWGTALRLVPGS